MEYTPSLIETICTIPQAFIYEILIAQLMTTMPIIGNLMKQHMRKKFTCKEITESSDVIQKNKVMKNIYELEEYIEKLKPVSE